MMIQVQVCGPLPLMPNLERRCLEGNGESGSGKRQEGPREVSSDEELGRGGERGGGALFVIRPGPVAVAHA